MILISGSTSVKFAQKFCIFLKFLTLEGTLLGSAFQPIAEKSIIGFVSQRFVSPSLGA